MKRSLTSSLLLVLTLTFPLPPTPAAGQEIEFQEFTDQQRWDRLGFLLVGWTAAMVALGEEYGMTPEEVGTWAGEFFSRGWLGGAEASQLVRGMHRNHLSLPGAEVEVLEATPTSVKARFNRPWEGYLGPGGRTMGVSGEAIDDMFTAVNATIAEWVGVEMVQRRDGEHDLFELTTEYGPIQASDEIRWNRGSFLSWLTWLQLMSLRKESGMTAAEIGAADARLYAPSWSARTPWQLFRGMVWNQMSDPDADCEVIAASPTEVRARCSEYYRELVEQNQERFGVTPEDVFESGRAFAEGVAEHLGLRWTESLRDGYRHITVARR